MIGAAIDEGGRPHRPIGTRTMRELMKRLFEGLLIVVASAAIALAQAGKRPLSLDDLARIKDVRDPQCAPDGKTVVFVV